MENPLPGNRRIIVATANESIVGFAGVGPARDEPGTRGELYMINLAPTAWGRGIGTELLEQCVKDLSAFGHGEAILWVLRQNARARRFYQREGWTQEGDRHDTIRENGFTFEVDELRYVRAIPPVPPP
jgi:GNAT superfamily N-acetyltransferase